MTEGSSGTPFVGPTPFVGRIDELALLSRTLDECLAGKPKVAVLLGEPAVGKTRLLSELLDRAKPVARVLVGACIEDLAIPYLPIATALRPLPGIASMWPDAVSAGDEWEAAEVERRRLRLFLDVTTALVEESRRQPVVLAIEDVHWADAATADLLAHLCRAIVHEGAASDGARVLIALTSRTVPEKQERFILERLNRDPESVSVNLHRFTEAETHAFVAAMCGAHPPADFLVDLYDATSGHPLLLHATITRLLERGGIATSRGRLTLRGADKGLFAADLGREVRSRLDAISEATRDLLTLAAFLGDGRPVRELLDVVGESAEPAFAEAVDANLLIASDDGVYRFPYPEVRDALRRRLDAADAARHHLRIAGFLEERGKPEDAFDIATHLSHAGADVDRRRVAKWAMIAGDRASAGGAWAHATMAYDIAVNTATDLGPRELADLLLKAGTAAHYSSDPSSGDLLRRSADTARDNNDLIGWAEALLMLVRALVSQAAAREGIYPDMAEMESLLDALGEDHPALRARVLAYMADLALVAFDIEKSRELAKLAEGEVMGSVDAQALARVALTLGLLAFGEIDVDTAAEHYTHASTLSGRSGDVFHTATARARLGLVHLVRYELPLAQKYLEEARLAHIRHGFWGEYELATGALASVALLQGRFGDVEKLVADALALYRVDEYAFIPNFTFGTLALGRAMRGDTEGATRSISAWSATGAADAWRYLALVQAWSGDHTGARRLLEEHPWPASPTSLFSLEQACVHAETAVVLGEPSFAREAVQVLEEAHARGWWSSLGPFFVPRLLAECTFLIGDRSVAARQFADAERIAVKGGARLEQARCKVGLALVERVRGRRAEALANAKTAAAELDAMGALVLTQRLQQVFEDESQDLPQPAFRVLLVTDLQDSTGLNVRVGDERYLTLLNEHDGIIRRQLREHDGVEFQHRGDGIAAWFTTASDAVRCAIAIRDKMKRATGEHPELPLVVRLGIAAGEPIGVGAELFGLAVVVACRICDIAKAGQILVAEEIPGLARGKDFGFASMGEFSLKGLPSATTLYEVESSSSEVAETRR